MAVRIEPEATSEAPLPREMLFGRTVDIIDEPAVSCIQLPQNVGERKASCLLRHLRIEGIDAAVLSRVLRWSASRDNEWQMFQRLFLPPRHMRDHVFHRPMARDARFRQLRV